jgi:hypothetical protein
MGDAMQETEALRSFFRTAWRLRDKQIDVVALALQCGLAVDERPEPRLTEIGRKAVES